MTKIPLTASQIKTLDEVNIDRKAVQDTLNIALQFHTNRVNELDKAEQAFWRDIIKTHNLDGSVAWKTDRADGTVVVTEADFKQTN